MAERKPSRRLGRRHTVTVYRADGTTVQYPKSQLDRIADSETFFTEPPTPDEPDKPKPKSKSKAGK